MKNSQKGFVVPILLVIIALLVIGGGVYVYTNKKTESSVSINNIDQNNPPSNTPSAASCGDFTAFLDYVLKSIQQPDSQNTMQMNKNVITSFHWKRKQGEPFITYPIINGIQVYYGDQQQNRTHDFVVSAIKNDSDTIGKTIDEKAKNLGFASDSLNSLSLQSFPDRDIYLRTFAFRGNDSLYSVALKVEGGGHQAPPQGVVTVTCGKAINQYDKVYNALNFKADSSVQDAFDDDYIAIADVSSDNTVYALLGSTNHIKIANYYYFDGSKLKLVSKDSYPAECATLESQKVGQGMRCVDVPSYNQRTVTYTSASNTAKPPTQISVLGMSKYTDTNLGFSFWYPSSWKVVTGQNSIDLYDQYGRDTNLGITKITQSNGKLLLPGYACGPAAGCADLTYYFDSTTHTWMAQHGTQTPVAADVSTNTMGGLHMLNGNIRFGLGTIIPLSARDFLMVGASPAGIGGGQSGIQDYLAATIVATDPSVATPVSEAQQIQTIQAEKDAFQVSPPPKTISVSFSGDFFSNDPIQFSWSSNYLTVSPVLHLIGDAYRTKQELYTGKITPWTNYSVKNGDHTPPNLNLPTGVYQVEICDVGQQQDGQPVCGWSGYFTVTATTTPYQH